MTITKKAMKRMEGKHHDKPIDRFKRRTLDDGPRGEYAQDAIDSDLAMMEDGDDDA